MRIAMAAGCVMFLVICIVLAEVLKQNIAVSEDLTQTLLIIPAAVAIILFLVRQTLFKKRMEAISQETDFKKKVDQFRSTVIISFALIEASALISIICYYLTGNQLLIGLALLTIAQFATIRLDPSSVQL